MHETNFKPTEWIKDIGENEYKWGEFIKDFYKEEWLKLSPEEMAVCLNYRNILKKNALPSFGLCMAMNQINENYPDFHMGCLPLDKKEPVANAYSTRDFSDYLNGRESI